MKMGNVENEAIKSLPSSEADDNTLYAILK